MKIRVCLIYVCYANSVVFSEADKGKKQLSDNANLLHGYVRFPITIRQLPAFLKNPLIKVL